MLKFSFLVGSLLVASMASAITMQFSSVSPAGSGTVKYFGVDKGVGQGILNFNVSPSGTLAAVCADLGSNIDSGYHTYTESLAGLGSSNIDKAARIVASHFADATDNTKAAGLQLAVWEALYDGGATFDGDNGNFQIVGGSSALADAAAFYTAIGTVGQAHYYESHESGAQGQFAPIAAPVPEPASMTALALGVGAAIRRRKASK